MVILYYSNKYNRTSLISSRTWRGSIWRGGLRRQISCQVDGRNNPRRFRSMPGPVPEFQVDDQLFDRAEEDRTAIFSESVAYYDQQMDGYSRVLGFQMFMRRARVLGGDLVVVCGIHWSRCYRREFRVRERAMTIETQLESAPLCLHQNLYMVRGPRYRVLGVFP